MTDNNCDTGNVYDIIQIVCIIISGGWAVFCEVMGYLKSKEKVRVACVGDCIREVMRRDSHTDEEDYAKPQPLGLVSYKIDN